MHGFFALIVSKQSAHNTEKKSGLGNKKNQLK